jgi:hypothetical protein
MNSMDSYEKEIFILCNALILMGQKIENFFEENKLYDTYLENTSFFDISNDNDRFCKFCLIKKVKNKIN